MLGKFVPSKAPHRYSLPASAALERRHKERIKRQRNIKLASEVQVSSQDVSLNVTHKVPEIPVKLMTTIAEVEARQQ